MIQLSKNKMNAHWKKIKDVANAGDKTKMCAYYQGMMTCLPSCYCDDPAKKEEIATGEKMYEDLLKAQDVTCTIKCGAGSALAPGMALTLALMVAARLYE